MKKTILIIALLILFVVGGLYSTTTNSTKVESPKEKTMALCPCHQERDMDGECPPCEPEEPGPRPGGLTTNSVDTLSVR